MAPPPAEPPPDAEEQARSTGDVYAELALAGERGAPELRRGRAAARVLNGEVAEVLFALQLMQLSQLTIPLNDSFDYAETDLYVEGDTARFERILLESTVGESAALQLLGSGWLRLDDLELDLRFRTRSGLQLVRDLAGGLSDQLYEIQVSGHLARPRRQVNTLPGLRRDRAAAAGPR